jgi:hypothetical protein
VWRELRYLRHNPPAYANPRGGGARKTTFQAALEQCEQFIKAAEGSAYTTRPVQLYYALSQGSRAVISASPRIANSDWPVYGHGLSVETNAPSLPDVIVSADIPGGLFQAMATVLDFQALVPGEKVRLGDIWPLVPESMTSPLDRKETLSAILLDPGIWPQHGGPFWGAALHWIRPSVRDLYEEDLAGLAQHLRQYPALAGISTTAALRPAWRGEDPIAQSLDFHLDLAGDDLPELLKPQSRLAAKYGSPTGDLYRVLTPPIGKMTGPLHPVLAWWAVLQALSSLARYEPAAWEKMIDVDSSAYATAVEHLLDDAIERIPEMLLNILTHIEDPG